MLVKVTHAQARAQISQPTFCLLATSSKLGWLKTFARCFKRHAQAYKNGALAFWSPSMTVSACVCVTVFLFVCVSVPRLTVKPELGWLLLWGVNLGLGGFPASLSLCLLLFMCCGDQQETPLARSRARVAPRRNNFECCCRVMDTKITWRYFVRPPAVLGGFCPPGVEDVYTRLKQPGRSYGSVFPVFFHFLFQHQLKLTETAFLEGVKITHCLSCQSESILLWKGTESEPFWLNLENNVTHSLSFLCWRMAL